MFVFICLFEKIYIFFAWDIITIPYGLIVLNDVFCQSAEEFSLSLLLLNDSLKDIYQTHISHICSSFDFLIFNLGVFWVSIGSGLVTCEGLSRMKTNFFEESRFNFFNYALMQVWRELDARVTDRTDEAKDNVKFLNILEKVCEPLCSNDPVCISKLMWWVLSHVLGKLSLIVLNENLSHKLNQAIWYM